MKKVLIIIASLFSYNNADAIMTIDAGKETVALLTAITHSLERFPATCGLVTLCTFSGCVCAYSLFNTAQCNKKSWQSKILPLTGLTVSTLALFALGKLTLKGS